MMYDCVESVTSLITVCTPGTSASTSSVVTSTFDSLKVMPFVRVFVTVVVIRESALSGTSARSMTGSDSLRSMVFCISFTFVASRKYW
ncbi:hypothetical protein D3C87_1945100 [compost metagenome]